MGLFKEVAVDPRLKKITDRVIKASEIIRSQSNQKLLAVGFFDLVGSTSGKLTEGHELTVRKVIIFNEICNVIIKLFNGTVVKNLGDGTLSYFENPLSACLASINIRHYSEHNDLRCKSVLSLGLVEEIKISDRSDILGSCVDKCFRMEKIAEQNQILIDDSIFKAIATDISKFNDIEISKPKEIELKGIGKELLREIFSKEDP